MRAVVHPQNRSREGGATVARVLYDVSMSLDGYVAGRHQSLREPLGVGGRRLHEWMLALAATRQRAELEGGETTARGALFEEEAGTEGAIVMGRNMFGGGRGPWGPEPWKGWWGEEPPFHLPVFVLTHFPRPPLRLRGTTFIFVTDGPESALEQARRAAQGRDVAIAGGGCVAAQYLRAGLVDRIQIHLVPVFLGGGVRLFDLTGPIPHILYPVRVVEAPGVTHITYQVIPH